MATGTGLAAEPELVPVKEPQALLRELQQRMNVLKSVYFEFTQERRLQLFEEPLRSEGVMLIEAPDRIRWQMTAPYESILLGSGRSVAQFEKGEKGWAKLNVGFPGQLRQVMKQMVLMQRGDIETLEADYTLSLATGAVAAVTMVPKDETVRTFLAALEIRFTPDFTATREVWMREPGGDATRIVFRQERRDVTFPEDTFNQSRPRDLETVRAALGVKAPDDGSAGAGGP